MPQPEAKLKTKLKEGFEKLYQFQPHFYFPLVASMMQLPGVPDIFVAAEGHTAWIEAKANDGKLRTTQQLTLPKMVAAGCRVIILHADMEVDKDQRVLSLCQVTRLGGVDPLPVLGRWSALDTKPFWHCILGIPYAR